MRFSSVATAQVGFRVSVDFHSVEVNQVDHKQVDHKQEDHKQEDHKEARWRVQEK